MQLLVALWPTSSVYKPKPGKRRKNKVRLSTLSNFEVSEAGISRKISRMNPVRIMLVFPFLNETFCFGLDFWTEKLKISIHKVTYYFFNKSGIFQPLWFRRIQIRRFQGLGVWLSIAALHSTLICFFVCVL